MNRGSTLFLKIAVFIIAIPALALCIFVLPKIGLVAFEEAQNAAILGYIVLGILLIMYVSAVPFYAALYLALKLLSYIDKNQAFSEKSAVALNQIKKCALTICVLYALALPFIYVIAEWDDAPGLILIGLVIPGASLVVAIFAAVLRRLLRQAIDIKTENDLAV